MSQKTNSKFKPLFHEIPLQGKGKQGRARELDQPTGGWRMYWEEHFGTDNFMF